MSNNRSSLTDVDLNLLYTFRTFVEHGNMQRTARALGRSQPAISARLHVLQEQLGLALLAHAGRRLELTQAGRALDVYLQSLFANVEDVLHHVRAAHEQPTGQLRVGALTTVGVYLLAPRIAEYRRRFPAVTLALRYGLVAEIMDALRAGQLDVVAAVGQPPQAPFKVIRLGTTRPVLVTRRAAGRVTAGRLAREDWLAFGHVGDAFFDEVWRFLERRGLDRRVQVQTANIQTLQALVTAGAGVTILPDYTVQSARLASHSIDGLSFAQPIWIAGRPWSFELPMVREFVALLS